MQSRPKIAQAQPQSHKPLTQTQTENQEFQQQKFEATKLELQAKYSTITPEGQERLTVLQAKMSGLLYRRLQQASSNGRNFANIPRSRPDAPSQSAIQTKLTIGKPGDKYEQEAQVATLVKQINAPVSVQVGQNLQREEMPEEEEKLQIKPMLQLRAAAGGMTAKADLETAIQQAKGGGQSLANNIRQPMEQAFGTDFSGVKIHTDTQANQLNQSIQAKAFTTGQDVFFRSGEYNPGSQRGQELLAHELTHPIQQGVRSIQRAVQPDLSNLVLYRSPLYRGMIEDGGKPQIGDSARKLGVRDEEITVEQKDGINFIIAKDNEGMSTAPDRPENLPKHRRNKDWGGTGKDPVWEIDDSQVTGALKAVQDKPTHVTVAASHDMPLEDFKAALSKTQNNWNKTLPTS